MSCENCVGTQRDKVRQELSVATTPSVFGLDAFTDKHVEGAAAIRVDIEKDLDVDDVALAANDQLWQAKVEKDHDVDDLALAAKDQLWQAKVEKYHDVDDLALAAKDQLWQANVEKNHDVDDLALTANDQLWQAKVEELAGRGVTLGAILEFYEGLWKNMPHFDPSRSTTRDVVRCSVIPLTAGAGSDRRFGFFNLGNHLHDLITGGHGRTPTNSRVAGVPSAYATQANCGKALLPNVMVTHHWANLFSHTVAAIVADAAHESFYGNFIRRLQTANQTHLLIEDLRTKEVLEEVYWLCAMSVNQHCSICGGFGGQPEIDTVLGTVYPLCNCSLVKAVSGASSEMNKFGDMMVHIKKTTNTYFRQVVVVDQSFGIFGRAWCVAELVEANNLGMAQHLKILDAESVQAHRSDLARLDISKCEASVPADKDYIMSKVSDLHAFNLHLREMLLHDEQGLFAKWAQGAGAFIHTVSLVASEWNELSPSYTARLMSVATIDFRRNACLVAIMPMLVSIGLFAFFPCENAEGGWKEGAWFLFLWVPIAVSLCGPFFATYFTTLVPNIPRTRQLIVRETVWSFVYSIVFSCGCIVASIAFDVFPVPLGMWVSCSTGYWCFPLLYIVFPSECRNEPGFRWNLFFVFGTLVVLLSTFAFAYPFLNAWYIAATVEGQALIVLIFLSSRILFELIGVLVAKRLGTDILPRLIFFAVSAYEWQMGIMLARATHWLISVELILINLLENAYFLINLPKRHSVEAGEGRSLHTCMRISVILLARELAEALSSLQFLATLICIYFFNPEGNQVTRGMSALTFTQSVTFVGLDAGLESLSLLVTCAVLFAKGWDPYEILRGFIALHGDFLVKIENLVAIFFLGFQYVPFGNDLTFKFEWLS